MQRAVLLALAACVAGCNGVDVVGTGVASALGSPGATTPIADAANKPTPAVVATPTITPTTSTAQITFAAEPATIATVGETYEFLPSVSQPGAMFTVMNRPRWASFEISTGRLWGVPADTDVGPGEPVTLAATTAGGAGSVGPFVIVVQPRPPVAAPPTPAPPVAPPAAASPDLSPVINVPAPGEPLPESHTPASATPVAGTPLPAEPVAAEPVAAQPVAKTPPPGTSPLPLAPEPAQPSADANPVVRTDSSPPPVATPPVASPPASPVVPPVALPVPSLPDNRAPILQGIPLVATRAGVGYVFQPTGIDPDGDPITWAITGRPNWATFDTVTGRLFGTPATADIGASSNIVIAASDGKLKTALPAFTLTVEQIPLSSLRLQWLPPTQNTDGSSLTNLAAYRIYHSTTIASALLPGVDLSNPGLTAYQYDNLAAGTHYFAITAISADGVESALSNVIVKAFP